MSSASTAGDPEALRAAARRAATCLAEWSTGEGLWPNLLQGGPYLDVLHALGTHLLRPRQFAQAREDGAWVRRLLASRNEDGGFALWHGGPSDFTAGIEAYLALRLAGVDASDGAMQRLGRWIADRGGLDRCPASTWVKLVWTGAAPDERLESIPPEHFFFLDYGRLAALVRQQTVCDAALSIAAYLRGAAQPAPAPGSPAVRQELPPPVETEKVGFDLYSASGLLVAQWARFAPRALRDPIVFRAYDAMVAEALRWPTLPVALHAALAVEAAGGRGSDGLAHFERVLSFLAPGQDGEAARPCDESVRDTALAALALGGGPEPARARAALLARFRPAGERRNGGPAVAGWAAGDLHTEADAETTALALRVLLASGNPAPEEGQVIRAAAGSLARLQQDDGGWGAMPGEASAADVTGTVMEALATFGGPAQPSLARAARFLEETQHGEGYWRGTRGVCLIHGTAMALRGLRAAGVDCREATVLRAGEWLRSVQNADGGWGESPESCESSLFHEGASTPAQTAWALLGLLAGGDAGSESVRRGFAWLLDRQRPDGGWDPVAPTRPGVAYAPYLMDPLGAVAFPLLALRERAGTAHPV